MMDDFFCMLDTASTVLGQALPRERSRSTIAMQLERENPMWERDNQAVIERHSRSTDS